MAAMGYIRLAESLKRRQQRREERKASSPTDPAASTPHTPVGYVEALEDLHREIGQEYPCFDSRDRLEGPLARRSCLGPKTAKPMSSFAVSVLIGRPPGGQHAAVLKGTAEPAWPPLPCWDPGLACLIDDRGQPVVYHLDKDGPAALSGVKIGMTVLSINGKPAADALKECMERTARYSGYSSERYLEYQAARWFVRQDERGAEFSLKTQDLEGNTHEFSLPATLGVRYLPRLPVPGVSDSADVSWRLLEDEIGYIYVRRIRGELIESLDRAVAKLAEARGLIVDVRGNSGGGFDAGRSHRNFDPDDPAEPNRPRFAGPMALLIDSRCISAGEGWASWFIANQRAKVFGQATAGASARKNHLHAQERFVSSQVPGQGVCGISEPAYRTPRSGTGRARASNGGRSGGRPRYSSRNRKTTPAQHVEEGTLTMQIRPKSGLSLPGRRVFGLTAVVLTAISSLVSAQSVPDKDTLLLLGFDHSTNADFSLGTATANTQAETTGPEGGRFWRRSRSLDGARDLSGRIGRQLPSPGRHHRVLGQAALARQRPGKAQLLQLQDRRERIHQHQHPRKRPRGHCSESRARATTGSGDGPTVIYRKWKAGTWHHLAFAWGQGQLHTYADGQETGRSADDALMPDKMPPSLEIRDCDAVIDDFRISKRMYTAEDARRSMARAANPPYVRLTEMRWTADGPASAGGRKILGDIAIPLVIGKTRYAEGITTGPGTRISVDLDGDRLTLEASIGVCPFSRPGAGCTFEISGDQKQLFLSEPLLAGGEPLPVRVPIEGVKQLVLTSHPVGGADSTANCVWAGLAVTRDADAQVVVSARAMKPEEIEMYRRQQSADDYDFKSRVSLPYFVVPKYWEDEIDPAARPDAKQIGHGLEAFAAPGEYEPVNFVLYACDDLEDVAVEVGDLKSGDAVLAAEVF